jgi:RNA polymerase sigma-54 factor
MSAIVPRLELRQGQSLMMTQQLQQSIKLLQMSSLELNEFIEQELEKNPLLEQEESSDEEGGQTEAKTPEDEATVTESETIEQDPSFEWEQYEPVTKSSNLSLDDGQDFEDYTASEVSLREFLLEQLNLEVSDNVKRIIGQHLIDLVEEDGYIREDINIVAALLNCDQALIENTLKTLQTFEPTGVCARNLSECLAIQLQEKNHLDPAMQKMLQNLNLVAISDYKLLSKICELEIDDIKQMVDEIRVLNPRPGSGFVNEKTNSITPDIFLRKNGENWHIELNSANLPKVIVNRKYYTEVSAKSSDKNEKKYLSDQFANANWLIKSLDSRAQTILKVAKEIVKHQENFFNYGIADLRPLTLREVAEEIGLHESTVSRVTSNKYMMTTRGIYELKYFFNASISTISGGGEGYSSKSVQFMIKQMIEQETQDKVLSDDTISEMLAKKGVEIARRTIAKYRELMKIPTSSERKRQKNRK